MPQRCYFWAWLAGTSSAFICAWKLEQRKCSYATYVVKLKWDSIMSHVKFNK